VKALLDTHLVLALLGGALPVRYPAMARRLGDVRTTGSVSVASLWEIAIKSRLGKLDPGMPLQDIAGCLEAVGLPMLAIEATHVVVAAEPEPQTRDPFDRLLLSQCRVEGLRLATVDRALASHPLALAL
jgi:PIN domain nuclease of toxin-antitoxin system